MKFSRLGSRATAFTATAVLGTTLAIGSGTTLARQHNNGGQGHGDHGAHEAQGQKQKGMSGASHAMHEHMMKGMQDMQAMKMKMTGDADHDFAMMMRMHHEHGIGMAEAYLKGAKDPEMRQLAQTILDSQKRDNVTFDQWLSRHTAASAPGAAAGASRGMNEHMMKGMQDMQAMKMKMTGDADHDFALMMRMHHEHGIGMAEAYLSGAKDPEMRQMAEKIIAEQRAETQTFDQWLSRHGQSKAEMTGTGEGEVAEGAAYRHARKQ